MWVFFCVCVWFVVVVVVLQSSPTVRLGSCMAWDPLPRSCVAWTDCTLARQVRPWLTKSEADHKKKRKKNETERKEEKKKKERKKKSMQQ